MDDPLLAPPMPALDWVSEATACVTRHEHGLLRLEAVAPDILRLRFAPSGRFAAPRPWSPVLELPPAGLSVHEEDGRLWMETERLSARLDLSSGAVSFATPDGRPFAEDLCAPGWREVALEETGLQHLPDTELPPGEARIGVGVRKRMAPDEGYFGFGQRDGRLNRRHRRLTHWTVDRAVPGHGLGEDNLYQAQPTFMAVRPGLTWGLLLNSTWFSGFDVGREYEDVLTLFTLGGELDYYILAGPTPAAVVEQLTRLTGRPLLPPLWALGFHQSRWSYGTDRDVRALADDFRQRAIPLDAIHLDIDYMDGYRVFTWDRERFPEPAATIAALQSLGIRTVTIVDPGVKHDLGTGYGVAESGVAGDYFLRRPDGERFSGWVWPDESLFPDFCSERTRHWWGDLHGSLIELGVDGVWCDMNEPSIVDRPYREPGVTEFPIPLAVRQGDEGEALHAETHNLYGHLMARATWEGLERLRPERRPWVLTRSAFVGTQRWAASWMGDNSARWEDLETSLPQLASLGLCGAPHVGVDIGGFYGHSFGELYGRWIELGAFYPFMRAHAHCDSRPQEPWSFGPEIESIARQAIELRYRLLPYFYTLAHRAHRRGEPWWRPLLFDFPDQADLYAIEDQIMIGPQMMIAPIRAPGLKRRLVELPPGVWYDFRSGARIGVGPAALVMDAPLGAMPVLVRGGSIITLGNVRQSTAEPLGELMLEIYPDDEAEGFWTLIEDDGESFEYQDGALAETDCRIAPLSQGAVFALAARRGDYRPAPRTLILRLHLPEAPAGLMLDETPVEDWRWDAELQAAEVRIDDDGQGHRLVPV